MQLNKKGVDALFTSFLSDFGATDSFFVRIEKGKYGRMIIEPIAKKNHIQEVEKGQGVLSEY